MATAPISRLPTELLESIFILLACGRFWNCTDPAYSLPDWLSITHVSLHWRSVALKCPILWSYVFTGSERWTAIFLERSKQAPLKLFIHEKNREHFKLFLNHAKRIREIRFHTHCWDPHISQVFATLCSSASSLQTLQFTMRPLPVLSPEVINDRTTLSPWCLHGLYELTTLSLHSIPDPLQQDVATFRAMLKSMPGLVYLYLEDALASAKDFISSKEFDALQKVDLPRLSRLLIVSPLSTVIAFLSGVNIPARTEIRLECFVGHGPSSEDYNRFCFVLENHYRHDKVPSLPMIRSVVVKLDFEGLAIIFSTSSECDYLPELYSMNPLNWRADILLEIVMELPSEVNNHALGSDICAFMPTTDAQTLHIIDPPTYRAFWRQTWANFPGLRRMKLGNGRSMRNGLSSVFLSPAVDGDVFADGQSSGLVLPALERLELDCMQFGKLPSGDGSDLLSPPFEELPSLYATLSSRQGSRGRLLITECYAYHDYFDVAYYDLVGQWDGGQFHVVSVYHHFTPIEELE